MDRPILFKDEMVRAILEDRKTQTRRALNPQPLDEYGRLLGPELYSPTVIDRFGCEQPGPEVFGAYTEDGDFGIKCPYGQPGDRLWVREAHAFVPMTAYRGSTGIYQQINPADDYEACVYRENFDRSRSFPWRPSIHMPRWASRITLEITDVRVERLKDVTEANAAAEGASTVSFPVVDAERSMVDRFRALWKSINGPDSWDANPWVWVIEFRRVD